MRQSGPPWGREGGVTVQISEEEMRIQKGGHHSDAHLFSFSQSHTHTHTNVATSLEGPVNISVPVRKPFQLCDSVSCLFMQVKSCKQLS